MEEKSYIEGVLDGIELACQMAKVLGANRAVIDEMAKLGGLVESAADRVEDAE